MSKKKRRLEASNGLSRTAEPTSFVDTRGVHPFPTWNDTTVLTPELEERFQSWVKENKIRDVDHPDANYDYRGAWLANMKADPKDMHWPDQFKQHGHETFSNESQYARGRYDAGHWQGEKYVPAPVAPQIDIDVTSPEFNRQALTPTQGVQTGAAPVVDPEEALRMRAAALRPVIR
jgi:hypothetical protein